MPLSDLLVIEFASVLAGPSVGMFLAELGARVVKVENHAAGGDVTRSWRLAAETDPQRPSAYFSCVNWGKESVGIDLKRPEGRDLASRLVALADVVLVSFKQGDAERFGLDPATVAAANPRAIYAEVTAYGPGDPRTGYDAMIQAETGFMFLNGAEEGPPTKMPVALMDLLAGHQLKEGILLALLQRERTGRAGPVSVSLIRSGLASLINQASNWLLAGANPRRLGSGHPNIVPYGSAWETADGHHVVLAVGNDRQFAALCGVLEIEEVASDPRFATNPARVTNRSELEAIIGVRMKTMDRQRLIDALAATEVPAGAIFDVRDALEQPAAEPLLLVPGDDGRPRGVRSVALEPGDAYSPRDLLPPPGLGQHTREVLEGLLGLDAAEARRLFEAGVVGQA